MSNFQNNYPANINIEKIHREYQIYFLLVTILIGLQLICNTIEPLIYSFGYLKIPASALFYVLSFAISDILTENFGFKLAVRATVFNVISQLIFCGIASIIHFIPDKFHAPGFDENFRILPHYLSLELIGSIVSLLAALIANDYIISRLKIIFLGKGFWWRTIVSTIIGEVIMLNIDYNLVFYGQLNVFEIQRLIFSSMIYKTIAAFILALPSAILSDHIAKYIYILKPNLNYKPTLLMDLKNVFIFK